MSIQKEEIKLNTEPILKSKLFRKLEKLGINVFTDKRIKLRIIGKLKNNGTT
jgi:hypothetical protein